MRGRELLGPWSFGGIHAVHRSTAATEAGGPPTTRDSALFTTSHCFWGCQEEVTTGSSGFRGGAAPRGMTSSYSYALLLLRRVLMLAQGRTFRRLAILPRSQSLRGNFAAYAE